MRTEMIDAAGRTTRFVVLDCICVDTAMQALGVRIQEGVSWRTFSLLSKNSVACASDTLDVLNASVLVVLQPDDYLSLECVLHSNAVDEFKEAVHCGHLIERSALVEEQIWQET